MLTLEDLTKRYGLSDRALRRRLDALGTAIEPYIRRGPNNALLFQDGALALLDRLAQLQREAGLGLADAAAQVKNEALNGRAAPASGPGEEREPLAGAQVRHPGAVKDHERLERIRRQAGG